MGSRVRLLALSLGLLAACARRSPHGIAERYLEDLQQFDYPAAYHLLSEQDRKARSLEEFMTEIPLAPDVSPVWFRPVLHQTHYELGDAQRSGQNAMVPVKVTTPDLAFWERRLDALGGPNGVSIEEARHSLDSGDYPKLLYDDRIFLVKEHHHWRVTAGFGLRDQVVVKHQQAMNAVYALHYDEAIAEWRSLIKELRSQAASGSWGLASRYQLQLDYLEGLKGEAPQAKAYAAQLKLNDVAMKMSEDRVPAIFGSVVNGGKRAIDDLVLAVTWYEGRGKDLKAVRREEHVIVATPLEFTEFAAPIRPLMPGESRQFGFVLSAPAEIEGHALPYVTIAALALAPSIPLSKSVVATPRSTPSKAPPQAKSSATPKL
jgi:hypothetical protein